MRVSLLILMLREVSSLSVGNYIQFGRSHESDLHRISQFGSKICQRSVTCVTCDTCVTVCDKDPEAPHQFPLQPPNPPTPIKANTFVHIPDSPTLSPSPFQYLPQEVSTWTLEEHLTEEQSHSTLGSAPISRTSPTNSREILQQLVQVLTFLGQPPPTSTPPTPSPPPTTSIRPPHPLTPS